MIDKKELRVGNYVIYEATTHIITAIKTMWCNSVWIGAQDEIPDYVHRYEDIAPIPLRVEELIKLGFELGSTIKTTSRWTDTEAVEHRYVHRDSFVVDYRPGYAVEFVTPSVNMKDELQWVHQLQNLIFFLRGWELTYKS